MVSSTPRPRFTPGKDPVPILREARWAPRSVWTGGKFRPHRDSILNVQPAAQSLYRLSYPAHHSTVQNTEKSKFSGISDVVFSIRLLVRNEAVKSLCVKFVSRCTYRMQISHFLSLSFLTAHLWGIIYKLRRTTVCYIDV